jgi:hypothetical protein
METQETITSYPSFNVDPNENKLKWLVEHQRQVIGAIVFGEQKTIDVCGPLHIEATETKPEGWATILTYEGHEGEVPSTYRLSQAAV